MSINPEENLLEQAMRDAFRDYDLPPDEHPRVWAGVQERIATLPAVRKGLPYRVVVPLTAVLGVAVGWLLPHPAPQPAPTAPTTQVARTIAHRPLQPTAELAGAPTAVVPEIAVANMASPPRLPASGQQPTFHKRAVVAQPQLAAAAATSGTVAPADSVVAEAVVASRQLIAAVPQPLPVADSVPTLVSNAAAQPTRLATAAPEYAANAKPAKAEESKDKTLLYHKPSHRQPERANSMRRWFSRLTQGVRHLLGS